MATRIPQDVIEDVRTKTNIADVISQTVQLHKAGNSLTGLCPFHEEKTPSFHVSEDKQIFHCFGCGRGGNVFSFIMELDQVSFPDAVLKVAEFSGISLPQELVSNASTVERTQTQELQQLYQEAQQLYRHMLTTAELGEKARDYLAERHLDDGIMTEFGLGFAPPEATFLLDIFNNRKVDRKLLVRSGLFVQKENGELMDRFRNRVMFPIQNANGQTIGFSGRILVKSDNEPKYLNSPETSIFQKREVLYHFSKARRAINDQKSAILFEGFMDVIAAYRAGLTNSVASMGTSLTSQQLYLLARVTKRLVICYDGDTPGQNAIKKALDLLENQDFEVAIVSLPQSEDPDEFVNKHGAAAFKKQFEQNLLTPTAFNLKTLAQQYNLSLDSDKLAYAHDALVTIAQLESTIEQDLYLKEIAKQTQLDLESLRQEFTGFQRQFSRKRRAAQRQEQISHENQQQAQASTLEIKPTRGTISEQRLLHLVFTDTNLANRLANDNDFKFNNLEIQSLFDSWEQYLQEDRDHSVNAFTDELDSDLRAILASIEFETDSVPLSADEDAEGEITDYLRNIRNARIEQQIKQAQQEINAATAVGNQEASTSWLQELMALKRQLIGISRD